MGAGGAIVTCGVAGDSGAAHGTVGVGVASHGAAGDAFAT
jgi:hypothetical protein